MNLFFALWRFTPPGIENSSSNNNSEFIYITRIKYPQMRLYLNFSEKYHNYSDHFYKNLKNQNWGQPRP